MMLAKRVVAASVLGATALALLLAGVPASAGTGLATPEPPAPLALSYDGVTWHDSLPALFAPSAVVPGDEYTRTVFVRNGTDLDTILTVVPEQVELYSQSPEPFYDELTLSVHERGAAGVGVAFAELSGSVLYDGELAASRIVALDVALRFPADATSGADAHPDQSSFVLRITLAENTATIPSEPDDPGDDPHAPDDGSLAGTGGTVVGLWWALAAIAVGTAAVVLEKLLRARPRERRHGVAEQEH